MRRAYPHSVLVLSWMLIVIFALAACSSNGAATAGSTTTASMGAWRSAYLGADGRLHFVSVSGERTTSVQLPDVDLQRTAMSPHLGISADGHYLAYISETQPTTGGPITVVNLTTGELTVIQVIATELHWAPDAPVLVYGAFDGSFATKSPPVTMVDMRTGHVQTITVGQSGNVARILGWIDSTHLAIVDEVGRMTLALGSLDLTTQEVRVLAPLGTPPDVFLSPDGKRVFSAPTYWNPVASVIDTATGSVHELPGITATFASRLGHLDNYGVAYGGNWSYQWTWRPGTHTIALSLSDSSIPNEGETQPVMQQAGIWLIDVDHDQARNLNQDRYPLAWTPDGRALLMSDIPTTSVDVLLNTGYSVGPHLYALTPVAAAAQGGATRMLAGDMVMFFGLVPND